MPVQDDSCADNNWNGPFLLQLVVLGMLIADKKLRELVQTEDFIDRDVRGAVRELKASGKHGWRSLQRIFTACHLEWNGKTKPIDAMLKRLQLDATCGRALDAVNDAVSFIESDGGWGDESKAEFVRRIVAVQRNARIDLKLLPAVRPVDANRDGKDKLGKVEA